MSAVLNADQSASQIQLTEEQSLAVQELLGFIQDPSPSQWYFAFSGPAGTGKTFCMREVIARSKSSRSKFAFTAPTNKAAKVLRNITEEAGTIYSLLGLRVDKSGEAKKIVTGKKIDLSDLGVIFVDEASMVNRQLFRILEDECLKSDPKVVFMGDVAQLPPVGETRSLVWEGSLGANLTKVMRHDNQILTLATRIRQIMTSIAPSITIKSDHDEHGGVWKLSKNDFKQSIYNAAINGEFADGTKGKVIAWRNVRVDEYNNLIRHAVFGSEAEPGFYVPGDRVVAAGPCMRGEDVLLSTDDEALVEAVTVCKHPFEPKYNAIELKCRTEYDKVIRLLVIHPASAQDFKNDGEQIAYQARANGKLWKNFWEHQDLFHTVKYAYALTVHRSQGSTYENVWVDYQDILSNRNRTEAFQCLYTASTRPTTKLFLA
jgi:exodeoxyribonuclease-5